jgi:hypothetical protein
MCLPFANLAPHATPGPKQTNARHRPPLVPGTSLPFLSTAQGKESLLPRRELWFSTGLYGQHDLFHQHQSKTAKDHNVDQNQNGDDQPMPDIPGL